MQWHRQMYYALYSRAADASPRGGPDELAKRILGSAHALNIATLLLARMLIVDPRNQLARAVLLVGIFGIGVPLLQVFSFRGEDLRQEFETERAFVWGAASLGRFAAYAFVTCTVFVVVVAWAYFSRGHMLDVR
jgi:hypothetical protein